MSRMTKTWLEFVPPWKKKLNEKGKKDIALSFELPQLINMRN